MTTTADTTDAAIREVVAAEMERCRALSEQDWEALAGLLADDLTHVHMPGRLEDKAAYLAGIKGRPRRAERRDLRVRLYGETAVMTGVLVNHRELGAEEAMVTQVWVRRGGRWQMVAYQAARIQGAEG